MLGLNRTFYIKLCTFLFSQVTVQKKRIYVWKENPQQLRGTISLYRRTNRLCKHDTAPDIYLCFADIFSYLPQHTLYVHRAHIVQASGNRISSQRHHWPFSLYYCDLHLRQNPQPKQNRSLRMEGGRIICWSVQYQAEKHWVEDASGCQTRSVLTQ